MLVRQISKQELKRMQSQGGVKIQRRLGTKKPESEAKDTEALSGAKRSEEVVPAPALLPVMEKIASVLERLESRDSDSSKKSSGALVAAKEEQERQAVPEVVIPKVIMPEVVESKTGMLPKFKGSQVVKLPKRVKESWTHTTHRDKSGYMTKIVSISETGKKWVHTSVRSSKKFIEKVISKSNSGAEYVHQFHRNKQALIDSAITTPVRV